MAKIGDDPELQERRSENNLEIPLDELNDVEKRIHGAGDPDVLMF
jgi:hypothetical protein